MAEAHGKNTVMSTMGSGEMSWMDEQVRCNAAGHAWDHLIKQLGLVLVEMEAHSGARICRTMEELAGKGTAT